MTLSKATKKKLHVNKKKAIPVPPAPPLPGPPPPTKEEEQRNARLLIERGPVRLFWMVVDTHLQACIAYCEACCQSERSCFGFQRVHPLPDEREALTRLKARHDCPHTDLAEVTLSLLTLEACQ